MPILGLVFGVWRTGFCSKRSRFEGSNGSLVKKKIGLFDQLS